MPSTVLRLSRKVQPRARSFDKTMDQPMSGSGQEKLLLSYLGPKPRDFWRFCGRTPAFIVGFRTQNGLAYRHK